MGLTGENEDGINMTAYLNENTECTEFDELLDGGDEYFIWPEDMPKEERERLENLGSVSELIATQKRYLGSTSPQLRPH